MPLAPVLNPPASAPLVFRRAQVLCNRIFDVADEIDLERARLLVSREAKRLKLGREGSEYLQLPEPPLTIELGARELQLRSGPVRVEAALRLFHFGAASVVLRVPVAPGTSFERLIPTADELYDSPAVEALCKELCEGVTRTVLPAF